MKKLGGDERSEEKRKEKYIRVYLDDDSEVNNFDLQERYIQQQIKMGDSLLVEIGDNVMFVKEIVQKILDGPFKLLHKIKFNLLSLNQQFILRLMNDNFYQIVFLSEVGEELFQLIEECIIKQSNDIRQLEFLYYFQIDSNYNQLIFNLVEMHFNLVQPYFNYLIHVSLIFELSDVEIKHVWKTSIINTFSSLHKVTNISTCWNIKLYEKDLLSIIKLTTSNKNILIQAQNILFNIKEQLPLTSQPSQYSSQQSQIPLQQQSQQQQAQTSSQQTQQCKEINKREDIQKQKQILNILLKKYLFVDISFFKPGLLEECDVMSMKNFWKWMNSIASNYISIKINFATSNQINTIIMPLLDAILNKNQTLCLDSRDLKLAYDLPSRYLFVHFKEDTSQTKAFKAEDWSFILPFINQYKYITQRMHAILDNISFRHTNRYIYSQIIDFSKINHKISHFTIVAPILIIQNDIRLKKLWKQHVVSMQILTYPYVNQKQSKQVESSLPSQQLSIQIADNKIITAVKRFRKNQYEAVIQDLSLNDQAYHLSCIIQEQKQQLQMNSKKQSYKTQEIKIMNNFIAQDSRERTLKEQFDKVSSSIKQQSYVTQKQTKVFFLYEQNSKEKNITQKIDMRGNNPEFMNEFVSMTDFLIVHNLQLSLQADTHDGQIDKLLKYFSNSKHIKNLKIKLFCNNLTDLVPKLTRFIRSSIKDLATIDITIDGNFNGSLQKDCIRDIVYLLPFKEDSNKLKSALLNFKTLNNLVNTQSMVDLFKYIGTGQKIEIKTATIDILKNNGFKQNIKGQVNYLEQKSILEQEIIKEQDIIKKKEIIQEQESVLAEANTKGRENEFELRVDCSKSNAQDVFYKLIKLKNVYNEMRLSRVDLIVNEMYFEQVLEFIQTYSDMIDSLRVRFLNIDLDGNKQNTYDRMRQVLYKINAFQDIEFTFRDQHSKEDAFAINYTQKQNNLRRLHLYFNGNQVYSDDFNYDRLINICASLQDLLQSQLQQIQLDLIFDNRARFLRCKLDIFKIKEYIFKNTLNLRQFNASVKIMNQFQRTFETHRIFDEQVRAIQTKHQCFSKYALIYKTISNSQVKHSFRKEIFWDSISLMLFGQLHSNLKPLLSKRFLLNNNDSEVPQLGLRNSVEIEDCGILEIFKQERDLKSEYQISTTINKNISPNINQNPSYNQTDNNNSAKNNLQPAINLLNVIKNQNNLQNENEDNDIFDIEFTD